jgi:DNA processing protein
MPHTLSSEMLTAWLRLSMTPGLGPITCQRLLSHFADPLEIERCPPHRLATLVPKALCEALLLVRSASFTHQIKLALTWAQADDQFILTQDHDAYPPHLKQTEDAPIVLFAKGSLARLKQPALAIVGARHATADGLDHARDFACALAQQGWCVVSGLALGVDAAAHRGAIQAGASGGGTIAVLGTGADVVYPRNHAELTKRILDTAGLIVSEFSLGAPARPHHFPRRNRIVAGLSHGVLVVEAALKSGSLLTAKLAVDMNRDVFAIPGSIDSPLSRGPHALIQEGAKLVESATDILSELASFCVPQSVSIPTATASLSKAAPLSPVWDAIGYDPVSEDILQQRTNMLPAILQCELLMLELNGHIERRPNGRVVRARKRSSTSD